MRRSLIEYVRRSRALGWAAALFVACVALWSSPAFARVDPGLADSGQAALGEDARATVTGGGTVFASAVGSTTVASFGLNARRPSGFVSGGAAEGRINYDRHTTAADRHVNVPVTYMQAASETRDHAGGQALLLGDCTGATCPTGVGSVFVYVSDGADPVPDVFAIYFCSGPPSPPSAFVPGDLISGCDAPEGGAIRSGTIQVRGEDR